MAKRKRKTIDDYEVFFIESEEKISDEELLERYRRYENLLYRLLFKGEYRKTKKITYNHIKSTRMRT
ncbi:hypothetical protein AB1283_26130 [Bacillus sp. S13(2024)]|uniref:hypothetical protein n=1 Tax=Bacillus sp. S13(2024) TaxID=3162885 RepID=UPI003D247B34